MKTAISLKTIVSAVLFATLGVAGTLAAAPPAGPSPQAAIATRQAGYKKMGAAMKALGDQLKSDAPAKNVIIASAQTLASTARDQGKYFPAGSGPASGIHTDALPNIWTDRPTFDKQMSAMIAETGKLLTVANGGDVAAIRAQAKATGATCGACHRQFRADT
jgi:cytochrome c556